MLLINTDDEPILKEVLINHLFSPDTGVGKEEVNNVRFCLLNFFLGYC